MSPRARACALLLLLIWSACHGAASQKVNYADVRARVEHAFEERAHEMAATLSVLQEVSKETAALLERINTHCRTSS